MWYRDWFFGVLFGMFLLTCVLGLTYRYGTEYECVEWKDHLVPIYEPGPKHHIKGDQIGYVNEKVCTRKVEKISRKPMEKWPDPVY